MSGTDRHEHGPAPSADARWLSGALALILAFMVGEVVAGLTAHSLALISDAAHMLTDAASIALVSLSAAVFAARALLRAIQKPLRKLFGTELAQDKAPAKPLTRGQ